MKTKPRFRRGDACQVRPDYHDGRLAGKYGGVVKVYTDMGPEPACDVRINNKMYLIPERSLQHILARRSS